MHHTDTSGFVAAHALDRARAVHFITDHLPELLGAYSLSVDVTGTVNAQGDQGTLDWPIRAWDATPTPSTPGWVTHTATVPYRGATVTVRLIQEVGS